MVMFRNHIAWRKEWCARPRTVALPWHARPSAQPTAATPARAQPAATRMRARPPNGPGPRRACGSDGPQPRSPPRAPLTLQAPRRGVVRRDAVRPHPAPGCRVHTAGVSHHQRRVHVRAPTQRDCNPHAQPSRSALMPTLMPSPRANPQPQPQPSTLSPQPSTLSPQPSAPTLRPRPDPQPPTCPGTSTIATTSRAGSSTLIG